MIAPYRVGLRCLSAITKRSARAASFGTKRVVVPASSLSHASPTTFIYKRYNSSTDGHGIPASVLNLKPDDYRHFADDTLELISTDIEDFFEDRDIEEADVDESAGIVTIRTGRGVYVINKQPANKQIWLSSPVSGPKRFDYVDGRWVSLRDSAILHDILAKEMDEIFGDFEFSTEF